MPFVINREELAWAAGFFDGEGSTHVAYSWDRKDGTKGCAIQISLGQSGEEAVPILARFNMAVGNRGKMNGPYGPHGVSKKVVYQLQLSGFEKVQAVFCLLYTWLSAPKKEQFERTLSFYLKSRR